MILQASFEVETYRKSQLKNKNPLLGKFRKSIFWDTKIEYIDINKNKKFLIQRVLERGNKQEIENLISIYSIRIIKKELLNIKKSFVPNYSKNIQKYILN
jgi:hypothetical protein